MEIKKEIHMNQIGRIIKGEAARSWIRTRELLEYVMSLLLFNNSDMSVSLCHAFPYLLY